MNTFHPTRRTLLAAGGAALLGPLCSAAVHAQPAWPAGKLITWVVPYPPGGSTDVLGRQVALHLGKTWVYGALINNVWSVSTDDGRRDVNQMLLQPFVNYNFPDAPGRYLSLSPVITADWEADSDQRWTVPLGLGIGQILKIGAQPVNLQAAAYYNVERPDIAARWQMRLQMQLLFPK